MFLWRHACEWVRGGKWVFKITHIHGRGVASFVAHPVRAGALTILNSRLLSLFPSGFFGEHYPGLALWKSGWVPCRSTSPSHFGQWRNARGEWRQWVNAPRTRREWTLQRRLRHRCACVQCAVRIAQTPLNKHSGALPPLFFTPAPLLTGIYSAHQRCPSLNWLGVKFGIWKWSFCVSTL